MPRNPSSLVAIVSFVCSVGNVPLAAVLVVRCFRRGGGMPMLPMMNGPSYRPRGTRKRRP